MYNHCISVYYVVIYEFKLDLIINIYIYLAKFDIKA